MKAAWPISTHRNRHNKMHFGGRNPCRVGRVGSTRGLGRVGVGSGSCWDQTSCRVGRGRVGVWVESGTGRGHVGVDSVSSQVGIWVESGSGRGRVGTGLRVESGGVESGSGSSRGWVEGVLGSTPHYSHATDLGFFEMFSAIQCVYINCFLDILQSWVGQKRMLQCDPHDNC